MEYFILTMSILLFIITIRPIQENWFIALFNICSFAMIIISLFYIIWK